MSKFHTLVHDEQALRDYIDKGLPPKESWDERFYFILLARPKYDLEGSVKHKGQCLKRGFAIKEMLFQKILQLEMRKDALLNREGKQIPESCLAVYIMPRPRDIKRGAFGATQNITAALESRCLFEGNTINVDPTKLSRDAMHKAPSVKNKVVTFDFDLKDTNDPEGLLGKLEKIVPEATTIMCTRGGYHVQVRAELVRNANTWYKDFADLKPESKGDIMSPVPGCSQGGFIPSIIKYVQTPASNEP